MSNEKGHPANKFHEQLYNLDETNTGLWWVGFNKLLKNISTLRDKRSVASAMFSITVSLFERKELYGDEQQIIENTINSEIIPLWERELRKNDNWFHIPGNVWEFASLIGGDKGRDWLNQGASNFAKSLPKYHELSKLFPDNGINNRIQAVLRGKTGWHHRMANLYKFCDLPNDVEKILTLCNQNGWNGEMIHWTRFEDYFNNLLTSVDLSSLDHRLVEGVFEHIKQANIPRHLLKNIENKVQAWKFARNHINRDSNTFIN